jgi:transposase-like protein
MMPSRKRFLMKKLSIEFKRDAASLILGQGHSFTETMRAVDVY